MSSDINRRTTDIVGLDLMGSAERLRDLSRKADMLKARSEYLEATRKSELAKLRESERARLKREGERATEARLDDLARASTLYAAHLEALKASREAQADAWAEYVSLKEALDVGKRQLSLEQTLINLAR